jgi:predicted transcriptional regulator
MLHQILLALTNMYSNKEYLTISSVLRRSRLRFHKRQKKFLLALLCVFLLYNSYLCDKLSKLIFTGALALVGRAT